MGSKSSCFTDVIKFLIIVLIGAIPTLVLLVVCIPGAVLASPYICWQASTQSQNPQERKPSTVSESTGKSSSERMFKLMLQVIEDPSTRKTVVATLCGAVCFLAGSLAILGFSNGFTVPLVFALTWLMGIALCLIKLLLLFGTLDLIQGVTEALGLLGLSASSLLDHGMKGLMGGMAGGMAGFFSGIDNSDAKGPLGGFLSGIDDSDAKGPSVSSSPISAERYMIFGGLAIVSLVGVVFAMGWSAVTQWYLTDHFTLVCARLVNGSFPSSANDCEIQDATHNIFAALPAIGGTVLSMWGIVKTVTGSIVDTLIAKAPFLLEAREISDNVTSDDGCYIKLL